MIAANTATNSSLFDTNAPSSSAMLTTSTVGSTHNQCPSLTSSSSSSGSPSSLPLTYAALPRTTKLEEEPNPFEQSFSKPVLPPVASIESPSHERMFRKDLTMWDSLRAGPLSPSMLLGPADNKRIPAYSGDSVNRASRYNDQSPFVKRTYTAPTPDMIHERPAAKRRAQSSMDDDEEKRKSFLERNRQAALKCRQRKKQWLQNLQDKVEYLTADNEQLQMHTNSLREQLIDLKTALLAHKTCPVNPQAVVDAVNRPIPTVLPRQYTTSRYPPTRSSFSRN